MAFWWPLLVLGLAYLLCRFLLMLIPPNVPSIDVDASDVSDDGNQTKENSYIYIPRKGMAVQSDKVQCYEPATMKYLGYFPGLTPDEVSCGINVQWKLNGDFVHEKVAVFSLTKWNDT